MIPDPPSTSLYPTLPASSPWAPGKAGLTLLQSHLHTAGQTHGHNLYFPSLDGCQKRQVRYAADRARASPSQAVFSLALTPHPSFFMAVTSHTPGGGEGRVSVDSSPAGMLNATQALLREGTDIQVQHIVRLNRSSGPGVPSPSSGSGTTAGTWYGAQAGGCSWGLVATFTRVQGVPTEQHPHCRHMASNREGVQACVR